MAKDERQGQGRLDGLIPKAARRAFRAFGFVDAAVVTHWRDIVGPLVAANSLPERLVFPPGKRKAATLVIRVDGGFGLELQHLQPLVIERVNRFFGYAAVERIRLIQGPLPPITTATPVRKVVVDANMQTALAPLLQPIHDPRLKASLERLGAMVIEDDAAKNGLDKPATRPSY